MTKKHIKQSFFAFVFLLPSIAFAQSTIYKCVDNDGMVSYTNTNNKKQDCTKTNLASPDNSSLVIINNNKFTHPSGGSNSIGNILGGDSQINTDEQHFRDNKRQLILNHELDSEKQQLDTVNNMLKNAQSINDSQQISQLSQLQKTHQQNIDDLNKELGIQKSNNIVSNSPPSGLPVTLPVLGGNKTNNPVNPISENVHFTDVNADKKRNKSLIKVNDNNIDKIQSTTSTKEEGVKKTDKNQKKINGYDDSTKINNVSHIDKPIIIPQDGQNITNSSHKITNRLTDDSGKSTSFEEAPVNSSSSGTHIQKSSLTPEQFLMGK